MLTEDFHSSRSIQYGQKLLQNRVNDGTITPQEQNLILKFLESLIAKCDSFGGGRYVDYISTLTHFRRALYISKPWYLLDYDDIVSAIVQYRKTPIRRFNSKGEMKEQQSCYSTNSLKQNIRIIRLFLRWLAENGVIHVPVSEILKINVPAYAPHKVEEEKVYSEKMIAKLVEPAPLMLKALIWTHYETGTRADEICDMRWKDIQWRDRFAIVTVRATKTRQELQRTALISMNSVSHLLAWRNEYPGDPTGENYVWLNQNGDPLKYPTYERKLKELQFTHKDGKKVRRMPDFSSHDIRRWRVTNLYIQGVSRSSVCLQMWGSTNTRMDSVYSQFSKKDMYNELERLYGIKSEIDRQKPLQPNYCSHCGRLNPPGQRFCGDCGQSLIKEAGDELIEAKNSIRISPEYLSQLQEIIQITVNKALKEREGDSRVRRSKPCSEV